MIKIPNKILRLGVIAGILFFMAALHPGRTSAAEEQELFSNNNIYRVENGPTAATTFRIDQLSLVTYVLTYHYNGGTGQTPGTIGLRHEDGTLYGPWQAIGSPDQGSQTNLYWICRPNFVLKPGVYTVIDSHPVSWSWNAKSGGGITVIKGRPVAEAVSQTIETPSATQAPEQTQKAAGDVLASQELLPSDKEQTVSWKDQVKVTIPAGLVDSKQTLTIAHTPTLPPPTIPGLIAMGGFDISLGDVHEFKKDLTIEIAYDPTNIHSDLPLETALIAMTFNPTLKRWIMERSEVDRLRKVVILRTNHLSANRIYQLENGYFVNDTEHFRVYCIPNYEGKITKPPETQNRRGEMRTFQARTVAVGQTKLAEDLGTSLEHAWDGYTGDSYKFKMPSGWKVDYGRIRVWQDPSLKHAWADVKFSGNMYVPTDWTDVQYKDGTEQMRHETAHELFHLVQNQYFNWASMALRRWFMEATADYAADVIAWGGAGTMPLVPANYFSKSINTVDEKHEYKTSRFVEYLSRPAGSFKAMWDAVAKGDGDVVESLNAYLLQRNTDLDKEFRGFVAYVLFDSKGPLSPTYIDERDLEGALPEVKGTLSNGLLKSPAIAKADILEADKTELSFKFSMLAWYQASVWGIRIKTQAGRQRKLKLERTDREDYVPAERETLDVYILKNDVRPSGGVKPEGTLTKSSPTLTLRPLDNDDVVYIVNIHPSNISRGYVVPVKISDAVEESAWVGVWTGKFDSKGNFETAAVLEPLTLTFSADGTVAVDGVLEYVQKEHRALMAMGQAAYDYNYTKETVPCVYNGDKVSVAYSPFIKKIEIGGRKGIYGDHLSLKGTKVGGAASGQFFLEGIGFPWKATKRGK
ncbi:MAG: hypothetical protein A2351_02280 [Omnitrophica bacterium RIFOXYB12_FULL_50_7]|nr:MAG: hypothetical protein A2351_02280 [Omnitrophica bacterium RIFOXYB12_FULL_50_7]